MASANVFMSEDQFMCSICLDVFTDPVSIPCGHNFCKVCITRHWNGKEQCQCPLCNEKFKKGHKLRVNTGFREVVEHFKKHRVPNKNDGQVRPGEVPCDCCIGPKLKAFKTCLVCLASYCKTHLESHQTVAALKRHKLTDPVHRLEDNVCRIHNRLLDLFCRNDQSRVCALCVEHIGHDTVPLDEEYKEKHAQLEQKQVEALEMVYERQRKVQEIKEALDTKRKQQNEAKANSCQVFSMLMVAIQNNLTGLVSAMDHMQKAAERQAEVLVKELEREVSDLQRFITKLEHISKTEDQSQLIKRFLSLLSSEPRTKNWSDISISGQQCVEDVKTALTRLEETLAKEIKQACQEFRTCCDKVLVEETEKEKKTVLTVTDLESLPEGKKLETIRQQYAVDVRLDPCTANDLLLFSDNFKEVQASHIWWLGNEGLHKFNRYAYVLGRRGFTEGRFYYEVQALRKTGWDLGVARASIRGMKTITPNPRNGLWIIRLRNNTRFTALNNVPVNLPLMKKPERVGVFVDYDQRRVSFYDVDTAALIYSFTGCTFNEKIYPFFSPGLPEDGVNGAPLVLSPVKKPTTCKEMLVLLYAIMAVFVVIALVFDLTAFNIT